MTKTKDEILDDIINLQNRIRRGNLTKEEAIAALDRLLDDVNYWL